MLPRETMGDEFRRRYNRRALCVDIELSRPPLAIHAAGYEQVRGLVRLHGEPLGTIRLPVTDGVCRAVDIRRTALKELKARVESAN